MIGELIDTLANLEFGILIAIIITVIVMIVIKGMNDRKQFSPLSYIIAIILCILLTYQMSRLLGACEISNIADSINSIIGMVSPSLSKYISSSTNSDIGWFIVRRIFWSILFIGVAGFSICTTMENIARNPRRRGRSPRRRTNHIYDNDF